jgi:hypothetical protein
MELFEIHFGNDVVKYVKTEANAEGVEQAIDFIRRGEQSVDKLLQALRILGYKCHEVKLEPVAILAV